MLRVTIEVPTPGVNRTVYTRRLRFKLLGPVADELRFAVPARHAPHIAPPGGDTMVDYQDLALMAEQWLQGL